MRVDYRDPKGPLPTGWLRDGETGEPISACFFFDTDTGEYGRFVSRPEPVPVSGGHVFVGRLVPAPGGGWAEEWGRRKLRFEYHGETLDPADVARGVYPPWLTPSAGEAEDEAAFVVELRRAAWPGWFKWLGHKLGLRRWCPVCRRMTWWHWTGYCPHNDSGLP